VIKDLVPSVSVTTRRPRPGEKDRKDYHYVSPGTFRKKIKNGEFLEWEKNFGNYYGTPRKFVSEKLKEGKSVLLSIDVRGAMNVKRKFRDSTLIFIKPPSFAELVRRLKSRNTDREADIRKRLAIAREELAHAGEYDHVVVNDNLENAVKKTVSIIKKKGR